MKRIMILCAAISAACSAPMDVPGDSPIGDYAGMDERGRLVSCSVAWTADGYSATDIMFVCYPDSFTMDTLTVSASVATSPDVSFAYDSLPVHIEAEYSDGSWRGYHECVWWTGTRDTVPFTMERV